MKYDVVIVGAGVVGLSLAWRLTQKNISVALIDRSTVGSGATSAAAGMLAPTAEASIVESELAQKSVESLRMWPGFVRDLETDSGISVDHRTEGTLCVAYDRDDSLALRRMHDDHIALGLSAHWLTGEDARDLEPGLTSTIPSAVFCPDDHHVDPRKLAAALAKAVQRNGGDVFENCDVIAIETGVVKANDRTFEGSIVVSATGAWSRKLLPNGPHVRPVKGQMLCVELGVDPVCRHVIRGPDAYLVPKSDGRLLIGASTEDVGFNDSIKTGVVYDLLKGAWEILPGVYDCAFLDAWCGFRPVTLDNEPILTLNTETRIGIATGHGRNGILLAPYSSGLMAEIVTKGLK